MDTVETGSKFLPGGTGRFHDCDGDTRAVSLREDQGFTPALWETQLQWLSRQ